MTITGAGFGLSASGSQEGGAAAGGGADGRGAFLKKAKVKKKGLILKIKHSNLTHHRQR